MGTLKYSAITSLLISTLLLVGAGRVEKSTERSTTEQWILLGTHTVDFSIDYDMIEVAKEEIFTAIKIKVKEGSVNVHKATIHFANGDKQDMDLPLELTKANDGKVIKLDGNERIIKKIGFWYDTNTKADVRGVIEVWGKI